MHCARNVTEEDLCSVISHLLKSQQHAQPGSRYESYHAYRKDGVNVLYQHGEGWSGEGELRPKPHSSE